MTTAEEEAKFTSRFIPRPVSSVRGGHPTADYSIINTYFIGSLDIQNLYTAGVPEEEQGTPGRHRLAIRAAPVPRRSSGVGRMREWAHNRLRKQSEGTPGRHRLAYPHRSACRVGYARPYEQN